jgi:hypothetical protein
VTRLSSQPSALGSQLRAKRGGFALLITITLLAFIVVLLLGLAVYTRVETSIAGNTQRQAQARENALLALNVALGQLQRHAGPDTRVTATAVNFGAIDGTRHYTGVWSSDATTSAPRTWLVSGNEVPLADIPDPNPDAPEGSTIPAPLAVTPAVPGNRLHTLVGRNATGDAARSANWVDAPLVDLTATGVPGIPATASATIGRYAWWVGDQGVKAPVAIEESADAVTYAPFDSAELRQRIAQQIGFGAGAADASTGEPLFDPRDASNTNLVSGQKVTATNQLAFLRTPSNAALGLARVQQNFHTWSPNNFNVLANTKDGGLRQDLSILPGLLGSAFSAWANYPAYMETFTPDTPVEPPADGEGTVVVPETPGSTAPPILPAYSADPVRRRYRMRGEESSHRISPVLSFFGLSFSLRNNTAQSGLEVSARCVVGLWNPYTAALVPEDLQIVIKDLPDHVHVHDSLTGGHLHVNLKQVMEDQISGSELKFLLPFTPDDSSEDHSSWLPGRVYNWSASSNTEDNSDGKGNPMVFYERAAAQTGSGIVRQAGRSLPLSTPTNRVSRWCEVNSETRLRIELVRASNGEKLAEFVSPAFAEFESERELLDTNDQLLDFAFIFRLPNGLEVPLNETAPWLQASERDPRQSPFPGKGYVAPGFGVAPDGRVNPWLLIQGRKTTFDASYPDLLLDRSPSSGTSYNEDAPVFELPRAPVLSLGTLQHFPLNGQRPFSIGNSWGVNSELNDVRLGALFDRFFFSGLIDGVTPATSATGDLVLPNPLLKPLRNFDGTKPTIDDIRRTVTIPGTEATETTEATEPMPSPAEGRSSKYFLQAGAFNLNSANAAAWAAVLRGVRFPAPRAFRYHDVQATTGTADDAAVASLESNDAQFFRFPQSAQETYKAEPGLASDDPEVISPANTHLFRRGMRTLTATQVSAFAAKIVELIGVKHAAADPAGGPYRSLEEFLSPSDLFAGVDAEGNPGAPRSLLEAAIADAGINADIAEFSSQWLTQGDVMTALAPILFPRSDTFVIRTYGEAVNPATNAVEGRAWAEAIVQRLPEYLDRSDPPETLAPAFDTPSDPENPESAPTQAHQLNKQFGRRFKVVSFRWLTRSDI